MSRSSFSCAPRSGGAQRLSLSRTASLHELRRGLPRSSRSSSCSAAVRSGRTRALRGGSSRARRRIGAFCAGVLLIVLALNSPLETIAVDYLVLFHLLQNVIISDWAPPLLILGPHARDARGDRGARRAVRSRSLTRPAVALPIWLVGWYVVHLGGVYDAAAREPLLLNLEHLFMIAIGLLFWWPVLSDAPRAVPTLARIAYVFAAFVGVGVPRPRADVRATALRLLREPARAALGDHRGQGSEPRRNPDDHRAGARLLRGDRLAAGRLLPRGGRGRARAPGPAARRRDFSRAARVERFACDLSHRVGERDALELDRAGAAHDGAASRGRAGASCARSASRARSCRARSARGRRGCPSA